MLPDVTLTELEAQSTPKPSVGLRTCIVCACITTCMGANVRAYVCV